MANVIAQIEKPTLVMVHNKTLAMQLYGELKTFFPENRVEYFVSYFDFYQPEAYLPTSDIYIDKNSKINQEIEMLRLSTLNALSTRKDVIVVASVAAIYGAQDPEQYKESFFELKKDTKINRQDLLHRLVVIGYQRNNLDLFGNEIEEIAKVDNLNEAQRLEQRTNNDLENLREFGICNGIENYARFLEKRNPGEAPYTLLDFFPQDFLTIIDESHMTLPQIRGMYNTDRSRKETLVKYGFRLPSALDNRPLSFNEFTKRLNYIIYTSATPGDYELNLIKNEKHNFNQTVQQVIRPTGLLDPTIEIKPSLNQINDIIEQIKIRAKNQERVFITTLTIRMAEELTAYLQEQKIKVAYLHNELKTLERTKVLLDLRKGVYDAIVGINLLREGLDVPEVSLICILDADKSGFLRNTRSLVQTIGRAARNVHGHVILYADNMSLAMKEAIEETQRRRQIQIAYNKKHNITPVNVKKSLSEIISIKELDVDLKKLRASKGKEKLTAKNKIISELRVEMLEAAKALNFEKAAALRDLILSIESEDNK
ncbi:excinuclease abc subunit b [Lasius niger]|uniref:UvrABC system protein B n=1 Tax=Lasius niger TaxID=67767 RepID=A0A0J7KX97_LASNI|nr:excinuclease abc subunit b [Lasius niger]